ncbi:MAG: hypothetical protein HDR00_15580 [Lachnospiraceae bacterium]|nr:hypothetical protein [Lachnospiraceae bacterium]
MSAIFQRMKRKTVLYLKINGINLAVGCICAGIALWLGRSHYGLQSYYINLLLQFFIPVLMTVPVVEKAKPFFSREIGEIIGGEWEQLFHNLLFVEVWCILYMGLLAMETKYLAGNTGDILNILLFQTFLLQGLALLVFILSGTAYAGCTVSFLVQMLSFFMLVEIQEFSDYGLIVETDYYVREYFTQRWYYIIILIFEWSMVYLLYRNRFKFCKWL